MVLGGHAWAGAPYQNNGTSAGSSGCVAYQRRTPLRIAARAALLRTAPIRALRAIAPLHALAAYSLFAHRTVASSVGGRRWKNWDEHCRVGACIFT